MRRDPILFFDQVILYEDELADNGIATLDVKVVCIQILILIYHFNTLF